MLSLSPPSTTVKEYVWAGVRSPRFGRRADKRNEMFAVSNEANSRRSALLATDQISSVKVTDGKENGFIST